MKRIACILIAAVASVLSPRSLSAKTRRPHQRQRVVHARRSEVTNLKPRLVLVPVVVRDSKGNAVGHLEQKDFKLLVDGRTQPISLFAPNTYEAPAPPPSAISRSTGNTAEASESSPRFLALYFDDLHLSKIDTLRATDEADHYLRMSGLRGLRVGVFTSSGATSLSFTDDLPEIHRVLMAIQPHPLPAEGIAGCPYIPDLEAYLIAEADDPVATELAIEAYHRCNPQAPRARRGRVDRRQLQHDRAVVEAVARQSIPAYRAESLETLAGLRALAEEMAGLLGPRSIVVISPGFLTIDLDAQLNEIISRAIHSDTIISAIDAGGYAIPNARESQSSDPRMMANRPRAVDMRQEMQLIRAAQAIQVLSTLAGNTGGVFVPSVSNLEFALREANTFPSTYYVLGFWLSGPKFDGGYHSLQVRLLQYRHLSLQARDGFLASRSPFILAASLASCQRALGHPPGPSHPRIGKR